MQPIPSNRSNESGIALLSALLLGIVGILLTIGLLTYAMGSEPLAKRHTDWNAALGAAQAGVDDYIYRLNKDPEYWHYGYDTPVPSDNPALTTFVEVPGAKPGDSITPQFKYRVLSPPNPTTGARIVLEVTGKVGNVERRMRASLARRGFMDYMYFTEYEQQDPVLYENDTVAAQVCTHWFDPPVSGYDRDTYCTKIGFGGGDVINGPLHTNDSIGVNGVVTFNGRTTSSWDTAKETPVPTRKWRNINGNGVPTFPADQGGLNGNPIYAKRLDLPSSNAKLFEIAEDGGCVYTGPTKITLKSNGRMDVVSPNSTKKVNSGCGTVDAATGVNATNLVLPANGVLYVQAKPTSGPYATSVCSMANLPPSASTNAADYNQPYYNCEKGDVFIQGTLKGRLTVGSARDINIIGNTVYNTPPASVNATDMLGLIANNFVQTYHPIDCGKDSKGKQRRASATDNLFIVNSNASNGGIANYACSNINALTNLKINAAILALNHSFRVPEHRQGADMGTLTVEGGIAQNYRGIVALTTSYSDGSTKRSGYVKAYTYDKRLSYQSPPHFLDPVKSSWQATSWMETKAGS